MNICTAGRFLFVLGLLSSVVLSSVVLGCSSTKEVEPKISEIPTTTGDRAEGSELDLLETGKKLYQSRIYGVARDTFDSLSDTYPESPYIEYAEIKAADADFELREYVSAGQRYEEILSARPGSPNVPYLILRAGRSLQLSARGPGRDQAPLRRAMELFERLKQEYPDSAYAAIGEKHQLEAVKQVAESEQAIIDFYAKRGNLKAVEARNATFALELAPQAQLEIPADPMRSPAPLLAKAAPTEAEESIRTALARESTPEVKEESAPRRGIHHVECKTTGQSMAVLFLSEALPVGTQPAAVTAGTAAKISIPGLIASERTVSCFASNDLSIAKDGTVTVLNQTAPTAMVLGNPNRVILVFPG